MQEFSSILSEEIVQYVFFFIQENYILHYYGIEGSGLGLGFEPSSNKVFIIDLLQQLQLR